MVLFSAVLTSSSDSSDFWFSSFNDVLSNHKFNLCTSLAAIFHIGVYVWIYRPSRSV
ncbi:hypothetical protein BCR33DRAFT_720769 [Rhizoclosmatium globosum]|uniref:Uncharacterized protein n=1 Tax=Rhizoclosmatium globosum TaxID=329046 RepID=A0A1Y2BUI9_9FUNG|nr:hypothetical protein BCR33DRAFT_720769 [Rhizoclosmatium globosum]|eukprot:ORY38403.1 hypothetical protein BCR33DRAFT_720769 [Rhizoclosmatium globosum]